jgi:hypothetical protein
VLASPFGSIRVQRYRREESPANPSTRGRLGRAAVHCRSPPHERGAEDAQDHAASRAFASRQSRIDRTVVVDLTDSTAMKEVSG